ncbi:MAG: helix-turn-helix transcriptional regulator [Verrucomicrobiota bacterium]
MLGKSYFSLVQALHESRSFDEVAHLLSNNLPVQFDGDHATIGLIAGGPKLLEILGDSPSSEVGRAEFDLVAAMMPKHPLIGMVDFGNPGNLGFAASDHLEPGEYRDSEFNLGLPEAMQADDSVVGRLSTCWGRTALIFVCREKGIFSQDEREAFDAVLFTARAVLERIASQSVEARFREYLLTSGAVAPVCLFSVRPSREVLAMNYLAISQTEQWWGQDEAFRELDDVDYSKICHALDEAWEDPIVAGFKPVELDLGGGPMHFQALPKQDGEVILVIPLPGAEQRSDAAVNAVLTKRQREIMEWIAEGKTSAEAAIILEISPRTVEKHLEAVFQRLGVENRIAAVRRFLDLKQGQTI